MAVDFCSGKRRYSSIMQAKRARHAARKNHSDAEETHIYFCPRCKAYHIGHKY